MAFQHGKNAVFKLDNNGGSLQDLSTYIDSVDFAEPMDLAETTTFGASVKTYIAGLKDADFSLSGKWDPTLDAHMAGIFGQAATVTYEYGPEGGSGGDVKYTGEAVLTEYSISSPVGDAVTWSATLKPAGAITRTTY